MKVDRNSALASYISPSKTLSNFISQAGSRNSFGFKLEDDIDKRNKNDPNRDPSVRSQLSDKFTKSSTYLALNNPSALKNYSGYIAASSYSNRARLVNNIQNNLEDTKKVIDSYKDLDKLK